MKRKTDKILNETERLSVIDVLAMQPTARVILKARGRRGLPHKIIQVAEDCICLFPNFNGTKHMVQLHAGDYVASYRVGLSRSLHDFYTVKLTNEDLEKIDNLLVRWFHSSLNQEIHSNLLPQIQDMEFMTISVKTAKGLDFKSKTLYASDGKSKNKMQSIIQINNDLRFFVKDTTTSSGKHLYCAKAGDVFVLAADTRDDKVRIYPISKGDFPAIKMQDRKERLLRKNKKKIMRAQHLFNLFRKRNREFFRN